jgi:hypothetical protein
MPVETDPRSRVAGDLFAVATSRLGVAGGSRWFFSGNPALGGSSPVQAIRDGRADDVKRALMNIAVVR